MKRQNIRKLLLIVAFLLFPIIMWYFSPYIIIMGAMEHVINGSFLVFALMLAGSFFFGRLFCGYLCPAAGLQECTALINHKNPRQGRRNHIKYIIWTIWIAAVVICFGLGKTELTVDPFYMTDHGISVANIYSYVIYYGVIVLIFIPAVVWGKRSFCHYFCWMAPFMVIGSGIGRRLHMPQIHISAEKEKCINCRRCNKNCPMSLDVEAMMKTGSCVNSECIQCGACVDGCPKKVLRYKFRSERKEAAGYGK